ncbi:hypothetical protein CBR_g40887 [Chara braunii]|uniref:Uncharacterized protein n=1 Tax=Chara braunii TaxID=69332 RepID=A0A388K2D6_CHABU|nr:hypothetical protein CBR_g40887 [Chara braunii]|eukprot:GBG64187.1 hypothetical protein CBR_g40887 [Chara braunii]
MGGISHVHVHGGPYAREIHEDRSGWRKQAVLSVGSNFEQKLDRRFLRSVSEVAVPACGAAKYLGGKFSLMYVRDIPRPWPGVAADVKLCKLRCL